MIELLRPVAQAGQNGELSLKDWIPVLSTVITGIVAIVGLVASFKTTRFVQEQGIKAEARKEISSKLNDFYGPYFMLQGVAKKLSDVFRERRGQDFRTLVALLRGEKFEGNDQVLLQQILEINDARDKLIMSHSGLVDDPALQDLLWKASAHFRMIKLAYKANQEGGKGLSGEVERFQEYVYPNELNSKIEEQINILQAKLNDLNKM